MPLFHRSLLSCLIALALPASPAHGVEPPAVDDLASLSLDRLLDMPVTGASKLASTLSETAAAATVLTAEDLRAQGFRTLADALASIKGVTINTDRSYSYIGVRGFYVPGDYNTRVLLLIDGNRVNDNLYDQAYLGSELPLDLALVERIEFIPGQASAIFGANALFGVINVVTRRPEAGAPLVAEAAVGSFGERAVRLADGGRAPDGTLFQWSASHATVEGDAVAAAGAVTPHGDFEQRTRLYLRALHGDVSATALQSERTRGAPASLDTIPGDKRTRNRDAESLFDLTWQRATSEHETATVRTFAGFYRFEGRWAMDYPPPTINEDVARGHWWGVESRLATTRIDGHKLIAGGEWQASPELYQTNFDLVADAEPSLADSRKSHRWALFAEDQVWLHRDWLLDVSLRWDRTAGYADATSSRVALLWKPDESLVAKAIFGNAYRTPNVFEAHYQVDSDGGYRVNPALRGESVRGTEFNIRWRPTASDRIDGSVYRNNVHSLIVQLLDEDRFMFGNQGDVDARGLEIEWEHAWAGGAKLRANLSLQRARDRGVYAPIAVYAPREQGNVLATLPVATNWNLGLQWQAVGRRGRAGGYAIANATLSTPLAAHGWSWSLGIANLFDRRHDDPGTDLEAQPTVAQARRSLEASAAFAF